MPRHDNMSVDQRISEALRLSRIRRQSLKRGLSEDRIASECVSAASQVCADPNCRRRRHCRNPLSPNCIIRLSVEDRERAAAEMNKLGRMMKQMTIRVAQNMYDQVESHHRQPSPPPLEPSKRD
jgi:hypothetical protein